MRREIPSSPSPFHFTLGRLMSGVGWLAVAFAVLRYDLQGPDWVRYTIAVALGSAAFGGVLGIAVQLAARRQEERPWGSALATTGLFIATLAGVVVVVAACSRGR